MDNNLRILKSAFESSGLSKREYAEMLGVSASHISDILNGKGKASNSLSELANIKFLTKPQEGDQMYRIKFEEAQKKIIKLLEENSALKDELLKNELPDKKIMGEDLTSSVQNTNRGSRGPVVLINNEGNGKILRIAKQ